MESKTAQGDAAQTPIADQLSPALPAPETGLLPCPFCGSDAHMTTNEIEFWVECSSGDCGVMGGDHFKRANAIKAWNTRAPQWQPIETAPRDNSWFLGLMRTKRQAVVRWGGGTWEDDNRLCRDPIYWMPLPAAPEVNVPADKGDNNG